MRDSGTDVEAIRTLIRDRAPVPITPAIAARLRYHRLAPLARHLGLAPELAGDATRAAANDLASVAALRAAVRLLDDEGLEFLLYKGCALGTQLYGRSELRPREDIDILLDGWGAVERAERRFHAAGWRSLPRLDGRLAAHAAALQRSGAPSLDLHARVSQRHRICAALPFEELRANRVVVDIAGVGAVPTLDPRDAFLAGALHYSGHHGAQVAPLIWLEDLARLAQRLTNQDWSHVVERALRHGLATALGHTSRELAWWTTRQAPPERVLTALDVTDDSVTYVDRPNAATLFLDDMLVLPPSQAFALAREITLPSATFLARRAGVARPRPYPLLWADRVLRSAASSGR